MILTDKNTKKTTGQWFASWFDTPYYHTLYKNRNDDEAHFFIDNLMAFLSPLATAEILDLACGKGRHSVYLAAKGFKVTGVDLSPQSIAFARQFEHENLAFFEQDMRQLFRAEGFDYIFNLFTSFGFFEDDNEHLATFENVAKGLKKQGFFVFDYLNAEQVQQTLIATERKTVEGIDFELHRRIEAGFIIKTINFEADGQAWQFEERVRAFDKATLTAMLQQVGLRILHTFGSYDLGKYAPLSPRLILIAQKV
jgi:SAM-dependent methyltransferase